MGHHSIRLMKWICYYDRSYYEKKIMTLWEVFVNI